MAPAEQTAEKSADIEEDQRRNAVGPELRSLWLPNWWLPPHRTSFTV